MNSSNGIPKFLENLNLSKMINIFNFTADPVLQSSDIIAKHLQVSCNRAPKTVDGIFTLEAFFRNRKIINSVPSLSAKTSENVLQKSQYYYRVITF